MGLTLKTAPATEPLSLADAKLHLAVTTTDDDALITDYIAAARSMLENQTRRAWITQTLVLTLPQFATTRIELPRPVLQSVTHVKYYPSDGGAQATLTEDTHYRVDTASTFGAIELVYGQSWPATIARHDAVEIEFVAGYGAAGSDVPPDLIQALKLALSELYEPQMTDRRVLAMNALISGRKAHSATVFEGL